MADQALRDALSAAYVRVRQSPHDPDERLALADLLVNAKRPDLVRRHVDRAARAAPPEWQGAAALGILLFKIGDHDDAYHVLHGAMRWRNINADALFTLSALAKLRRRDAEARRTLVAAAWLQPVSAPQRIERTNPTLLRIRSIDGSHFDITRDPERDVCRRSLRRGHFSIKSLLDKTRYNIFVANVCGDNLVDFDGFPPFHLVLNTIACPDLKEAGLKFAETVLSGVSGVPIINHPTRVLQTTRARNSETLRHVEGVRFPRTELFANDTAPEHVIARIEDAGFRYPMILRRAGTQTGMTMVNAHDRSEARVALADIRPGTDLYAIEYIDGADADGLYHKTRAFFIDGVFYPVANLTSDHWQIHSGDRYSVMSSSEVSQSEERAYLSDPEAYLGARAWRGVHRINEIFGLDFFGIDFTLDDDGNAFVFEANAAMRHNYDHAETFPYTRPYLDTISHAFDDMIMRRLKGHRAVP